MKLAWGVSNSTKVQKIRYQASSLALVNSNSLKIKDQPKMFEEEKFKKDQTGVIGPSKI